MKYSDQCWGLDWSIWTIFFAKCKFCICWQAVEKSGWVFHVFLPPNNWPFFRKVAVFQNWGACPSILEKWSFINALSVAPWTMIMVHCQSVFQNWGAGPSILEKASTINESSWNHYQSKIAQNYYWFTVQRGPLICIISDLHLIGQAWKRCI